MHGGRERERERERERARSRSRSRSRDRGGNDRGGRGGGERNDRNRDRGGNDRRAANAAPPPPPPPPPPPQQRQQPPPPPAIRVDRETVRAGHGSAALRCHFIDSRAAHARAQTCPLLLRVFPKLNGHHRPEDFPARGPLPRDEFQARALLAAAAHATAAQP
jgi:hypothetical protein